MRPEPTFADKNPSKFRDYSIDTTDPLKERVRQTYRQMHLNQTVDFVKGKDIWAAINQKQIFIKNYNFLRTPWPLVEVRHN